MANKGESSNSQRKDVEGYIHNVSAIKTPPSGNNYFDFTIQESADKKRVVCFSPAKRESIKEKEIAKTPVRILNVSPQKRKFQPDSIEYKMGGKSKVVNTTNIPFAWAESEEGQPKRVSIGDIVSSASSIDVDDKVSLQATVYFKDEAQLVYSHAMRKTLMMCNLVIADETGAIRATIWESMINEINEGQSYEFKKFKINFFNNKFVNGTLESVVSEGKVVNVPNEVREAAEGLKPRTKERKHINGRIVGADVVISLVCINCKNRIEELDDANRFIDCQSCKITTLKEFLKPAITANLILMDESGETLGRFHCPEAVLNEVFETLKENEDYNIEVSDVSKLSRKLITETLLLVKKASFQLLMDDRKVAAIGIL